ncbi:MAG TPA: hypothetical protein VJO34_08505 [Methylomirabilota bacterium]|nr:hypothetical protein [Methylomirabilota bacterium]
MDQADLLRYLVDALEELGIDYMITGSQASIFYGEPRFTQDIDVVVDLKPDHLAAFIERFPSAEFYLSEEAAREAIRTRGQFNIIHPDSGMKIDVVVKKDTPYDRAEFERRQRQPIVPGKEAYFVRPEDVVLYKMLYYREGGSERHLRDIAGMLRISRSEIDIEYVTAWAQRLGLSDIWKAILGQT